ncbi:MAG: chromosome segregation protein SMC, partial [Bryobacteraceae bacterium]
IDLLRADLDGRATFLVHPDKSSDQPEAPPLPEGSVGRLRDRLKLTNGLTNSSLEFLPRLEHCSLAEDRGAARQIAERNPQAWVLLADGVSYHGRALSGGKKTGSGPLALKRELREVTSRLAEKEQAVGRQSSLIEEGEKEIALLTEDLERLRVSQQEQEKDALALEHESRKLHEELSRAESRLSVSRQELDRLRKESERAAAQRDQDEKLASEKDQARQERESQLERLRAELEQMQAEAGRVNEEHSALRAALAGLEERARSEKSAHMRLETEIREATARRDELAREMERLGVERARLLADNIELDTRAGKLDEEIGQLDGVVAKLASEEDKLRAGLAEVAEILKQLRINAQAAQEKRSQVEVDLVKKQAELKYLDETSRKELNAPLEEIASTEETVLDEAGLEEAERKYQELRAKIEALGPVNPQALEEYEESQQRYEFLNAQRQDLLDSIRDTERAIQEIDVETRKRFVEAFEAINIHFREMFKTLFGGGIGEMRLTDEENAAESGID